MTEGVKKALVLKSKKYARIDYDDDDADILPDMVEATVEELAELIPNFDSENMTGRQRLLVYSGVKHLYDNREKYGDQKAMQAAVSGMLFSEIYEKKAKE